jgi:TRAP-type C4-dicarboxylate transport system permease small subunit
MVAERDLGAQILQILQRLEDGLLALVFGAMVLLALAQIVLRNLFDVGLAWSDPLLRVLVLWVGLLAAAVASRDDRHIAIDLVARWAGDRSRSAIGVVTALFTAAVCAVIAWNAARLVALDREAGVELTAGMPGWLFELIIPLSFGVIALRYLIHATLRLATALRPGTE